MSAWKSLSPTAAKYLIRCLVAPARVTFQETSPPFAVFLGRDSRAKWTGPDWESIVQQINKELYADLKRDSSPS